MRFSFLSLHLTSSLVGCAGEASQNNRNVPSPTENVSATESAASGGRVGSHGMVVAGTPAEAFLSHIPMFGQPHDVQAVVAGAFSSLNGSTLPESFSEHLFTFVPDRMSLD